MKNHASSVTEITTNTTQLVSTGLNKHIPTDTNWYDNDLLFEMLSDLTNSQFRAWYCRKFYLIGRDKTLQLASIARADGKDPRKLFSHLLRKA